MSEPTPTPNLQSPKRASTFLALIRGRLPLVAVVLLAVLFLLLTALVLRADLKPTLWDAVITDGLQELPRFPVGDVLEAVSWPGFRWQNWIIPGLVITFMFWRGWRTEAVFTALAALGGFTADIVKNIIDRPRPPADLAVAVLDTYSFPSGHVTSYAVFYGFLFYLGYTLLSRKSLLRWASLLVCGALVVLVGPSRVYMGQHWASDAIAGYALGFGYLLLVIELYRFWLKRHPKASAQGLSMTSDDGQHTARQVS